MKSNNLTVKIHDDADDKLLKFAVIISRSNGKWVFCKHKQRKTLECPGGHREPNETVDDTARRELYEETGAVDYEIKPLFVYSVTGSDGVETFGKVYFADIKTFEQELHSEIEKVVLLDDLPKSPEDWTYPQIQPILVDEYIGRFC